jgi:hypothetical protein
MGHVVDVHPNGVERNVRSAEVTAHAFDGLKVWVSVAALVVPKAPVGHHSRAPHQRGVLGSHLRVKGGGEGVRGRCRTN